MPFTIIQGDITEQRVGAIVNAANPALKMGGGVCGAIFRAAGPDELQAECDAIGGVETGGAVITNGYALPADYIIHTAGPVWRGGRDGEEALLKSCYQQSLRLAEENGVGSIAFPLISSGVYGYPRRAALDVAENAIRDYLSESESDMDVLLILLTRDDITDRSSILSGIERYLKKYQHEVEYDNKVIIRGAARQSVVESEECEYLSSHFESDYIADEGSDKEGFRVPLGAPCFDEIVFDDFEPEEGFAERLRRHLIEKGIEKDSTVYKQANITKDVWSKIFSKKDHIPSKRTAVAIAISLRLNLDQTLDLLKAAGHVLSESFIFDQIIIYCINNNVFDIYGINEILFKYEQPLLGSFPAE